MIAYDPFVSREVYLEHGVGHRLGDGAVKPSWIDRAPAKPVLEEVLAEGRLSLSADEAKNVCHARHTAERAPPDIWRGPYPRAEPSQEPRRPPRKHDGRSHRGTNLYHLKVSE